MKIGDLLFDGHDLSRVMCRTSDAYRFSRHTRPILASLVSALAPQPSILLAVEAVGLNAAIAFKYSAILERQALGPP
jgi:hypothetical protein